MNQPPHENPVAPRRDRWVGVALVAVASVGFGFMALFRHWANLGGVSSAQSLLFLRFAIAGVVFVAVMACTRIPWPRGRTLLWLIGLGAIGYFGEALCYFKALELGVPSGLTSVLLYLYPGLVAVLARVFFKEKLSIVRVLAIVAAFVGTVLAIDPFGGTSTTAATIPEDNSGSGPLGIAFGIGSALMYALYIVVGSRVTKGVDAIACSAVVSLSAAAAFGTAALATGPTWPTAPIGWLGVLTLALLATVVSVLGIIAGMQKIGPVDTSTIATLEAMTTVAVGAIFLHEQLGAVQWIGGGLILAAAVVMARARRISRTTAGDRKAA